MAKTTHNKLNIFLCHASKDKPQVRDYYHRLIDDGYPAWIDEEKLQPGRAWKLEIEKAIQNSNVVIIFLSKKSVDKEGYVQREISDAVELAEKNTKSTLIIPVRLEDCSIPKKLSNWTSVDLYQKNGFIKLKKILNSYEEKVQANSTTFYEPTDTESLNPLTAWLAKGAKAKISSIKKRDISIGIALWAISFGIVAYLEYYTQSTGYSALTCNFMLLAVQWGIFSRLTNRAWTWIIINAIVMYGVRSYPFYFLNEIEGIRFVDINYFDRPTSITIWIVWFALNLIVAPAIMWSFTKIEK